MKKGGSSPKYIQKLEGSPVIYSHTEEHMIRGKTDARSKTLSKKKASKKKASKKNASKKKASKKKKKQYAPADVDEALKAWWDSEAGREKKWKMTPLARKYGIPISSFSEWIGFGYKSNADVPISGPCTFLTANDEELLGLWVLDAENWCCSMEIERFA